MALLGDPSLAGEVVLGGLSTGLLLRVRLGPAVGCWDPAVTGKKTRPGMTHPQGGGRFACWYLWFHIVSSCDDQLSQPRDCGAGHRKDIMAQRPWGIVHSP